MKTAVFRRAAILAGVAAAHLRLPFALQPVSEPLLRHGAVGADDQLRYSVNVTVGTPPQDISLFLSLDSPTTWVADALWYDDDPDAFNTSDSSSYEELYGTFANHYTDDTVVSGKECLETVRVGDAEMSGLNIGLAWRGEFTRGELAIGPAAKGEYSILDNLVSEDLINSPSYSFWLDSSDAASGNLLFGAVDTSAFESPLQRVSAHPDESPYNGFPVDFSILNYTTSSDGNPKVLAPQNDLPLIRIRPTDMISNFPSSLAQKVWDLAGATYDKKSRIATIPCSGGKGSLSELILGLGASGLATVRVSFDDLIIPHDIFGSSLDSETCTFAIQSMSDTGKLSDGKTGPWALGSIVLRNTYTVFDAYNDEVALGPVRSTDGADRTGKVVPFSSYHATIPESEDAEHGCTYSHDCEPDSASAKHHGGLGGTSPLILMIVGILLVLAVFVTLLFFCFYRGWCCFRGRRRKREAAAAAAQSGPISEKVVYAGALPPDMPPRPTRPHIPGQASGELPLGCAWVPGPLPSGAPVWPFPPNLAAPPAAPSDAQAAGPGVGPTAVTGSDNPPVPAPDSSPTSPSASPPPCPSAPPPAVPRGVAPDSQPAGSEDRPTNISHPERPFAHGPVSPLDSPSAGPSSPPRAPSGDGTRPPTEADVPTSGATADEKGKGKATSSEP